MTLASDRASDKNRNINQDDMSVRLADSICLPMFKVDHRWRSGAYHWYCSGDLHLLLPKALNSNNYVSIVHSQSHFYQLPTSARRSIPHTHRQCECCNDRSIDRLMAMIIAKNVIGGVLIDRHSYSLTGKVCCGWHLHTCILDCIIHYNLLFVFPLSGHY